MEDNNKGIYDKSDAKSSENYEDGVIVFDNDDVCDDISSYDVVVSDPNIGVDEKCDDAGFLCNNVLDTEGNSGNSAKSSGATVPVVEECIDNECNCVDCVLDGIDTDSFETKCPGAVVIENNVVLDSDVLNYNGMAKDNIMEKKNLGKDVKGAKTKKKRWSWNWKWTLMVLWILTFSVLGLFAYLIDSISKGKLGEIPPISDLQNPINKSATRVYSDDGVLLGTWSYASANRLMLPSDSLPRNLVNALIATEDVRFHEHSGIDLKAVGRAVVKRGILGQKSAGGGSTITQQLAKQLYSDVARDELQRLMQKPVEWYIAVLLERNYTKEEIIAMYLNYFDFLNNAVGIRNAAKTYFNKQPIELTLEECATLVGMCKNPSYYNPIRFNERCKARRNVVLSQMEKYGFISHSEMLACQSKPLDVSRFHVTDHNDGYATYFRDLLRRKMMAKKPERSNYASWQYQQFYDDSLAWATDPLYGWCNKNQKNDGSNYNIYTDGLKVYTSIDSRMQIYAEEAVRKHIVETLQPQFDNQNKGNKNAPYARSMKKADVDNILKKAVKDSDRYKLLKKAGATEEEIVKSFNTEVPMTVFAYYAPRDTVMTPLDSIRYYKSFLRCAFMAMDPRNGYVKAYVPGLNFRYFQYDNVMGGGRRQVGSTVKPYLYALAMQNGFTPCDELLNTQPEFDGWSPRGSGYSHVGEMISLKMGLAQSNNWIAARLMNELNPVELVGLMKNMGITNQKIEPTMSLCLGPCDVSVGEMVSAYTSFVNAGVRYAPLMVTRIEDSDGSVLATFRPQMNEVLKKEAAYNMLIMMRDVIDNGTGRRMRFRYNVKADMAGKTGTTNSNADGWFMGVLPKLVMGCWVGGDDRDIRFESMTYGQGAAAALPVCGMFLQSVYKDKTLGISEDDKFDIPEEYEPCTSDLDDLEWAEEEEAQVDDEFM
jgi:penicillin-binding protein 1A